MSAETTTTKRCSCGAPAVPNRKSCGKCLRKNAAYTHKAFERRRAEGLCVRFGCKHKPEGKHAYCPTHLEEVRIRGNARWQARRQQKLCVECNKPTAYGMARCLDCRGKYTKSEPLAARKEKKRQNAQRAQLETTAYQERLLPYLQYLNPRLRFIIKLRSGIETVGAWRLEDIGRALNLTRERVRQLEVEAWAILQQHGWSEPKRAIPFGDKNMSIKLEEGIEIPPAGRNPLYQEIEDAMRQMAIGQSFFIELNGMKKENLRSQLGSIGKQVGITIARRLRKENEKPGIRVWRIE